MKFWLIVLGAFALFIAGAAALPHLLDWHRHGAMREQAEAYICGQVRDPSGVKINAQRATHTHDGAMTLLTYDITALNGLGGPVRENWTFEYDTASKRLLSVKQGAQPRRSLP